mmetsp:Transcript_94928/g.306449  ORF Transcript_94928/g.306449 Transcript_94928/m.306449 type:complete len:251 (+) Transcript_94928:450-1202(+)
MRADKVVRGGGAVTASQALKLRQLEATLHTLAVHCGVEHLEPQAPADKDDDGTAAGLEVLQHVGLEDRAVLKDDAGQAPQEVGRLRGGLRGRGSLQEVAHRLRSRRGAKPGRGLLAEQPLARGHQAVQREGRARDVQEAGHELEVGGARSEVARFVVAPCAAEHEGDETLGQHHLRDAQHAAPASVAVDLATTHELQRRRDALAVGQLDARAEVREKRLALLIVRGVVLDAEEDHPHGRRPRQPPGNLIH